MKFIVQTLQYLALSLLVIKAAPAIAGNFLPSKPKVHTIAIANLGPHASLLAAIKGFKEELVKQGFDQKHLRYVELDVGFNRNAIPSMLAKLSMSQPDLILTMTTSVSQSAKSYFHRKQLPQIYAVVTDPVKAGLIPTNKTAGRFISGSSDRQDYRGIIQFIQKVIPGVKTVGVPYSTAEANDFSQMEQLKVAAKHCNVTIVGISVDDVSELPLKMRAYKDKIDALYVGSGNMIQPALPVISAIVNKYSIPLFSLESSAVERNQALGSYSVSYEKVGENAGKIAAKVLNGTSINKVAPLFPDPSDHRQMINRKMAKNLKIDLSSSLENIMLVGGRYVSAQKR